MKFFLPLLIFISLLSTQVEAQTLYRHLLPFTVETNTNDVVIIDYDMSQKTGIRCKSNTQHKTFITHFSYKGKEKSARLPLLLQSDHVPTNKHEELADVSGQFRIVNHSHTNGPMNVMCDYA